MILLAGFYQDPSPERTEELIECVRRNAANASIDGIILFSAQGIPERTGIEEPVTQ